MTTAIVDVGMGNVGSVANMLRKVGDSSELVDRPDQLAGASRIVLPGVGAFDVAMARLRDRGFVAALDEAVGSGVPLLGICLGMQLLLGDSEEGPGAGLGWIDGSVRRLPATGPDGERLPIPHMGWSELEVRRPHPLLADLPEASRFYFVHSFAAVPTDPDTVVAEARHGERFTGVVAKDNVLGVQFHPEKSHRYGMALMANFVAM